MLVVKFNLIDNSRDAAAHRCVYSNVVEVVAADDYVPPAHENFPKNFGAAARVEFAKKFINMVSIVAYFYRIRGHHFLADFAARYVAVWRKCQYTEDHPGLDWEKISSDALTCIYPDDLDVFWIHAASNQMCSGTLAKRLNSAPAGAANVAALRKGIDELYIVISKLSEILTAAEDELMQHIEIFILFL